MNEQQWPCYQVFQQEKPEKPHYNIGSVYATDAEMAMQNARDVYCRRPDRVSLWVAPADQILTMTAEELALHPNWSEEVVSDDATAELYAVFVKSSYRRSAVHVHYVGEVEAKTAVSALQQAIVTFTEGNPFVWWVCPTRAISRSQEDDIASMFTPVHNKPFRMPNYYHTVTAMRKIKRGNSEQ